MLIIITILINIIGPRNWSMLIAIIIPGLILQATLLQIYLNLGDNYTTNANYTEVTMNITQQELDDDARTRTNKVQ